MLKSILHVVATAGALLLIAHYVPGISIASFTVAAIVALVWGLIGLTLKPILGLLTLPINLLTLGLFSFVLNALLFWLMAMLVPGFEVSGFIPALEGSVILSLVAWVINMVL
ncbi:MAG: phage holin family protein [Patescibacteria group bacterium]